MQNTFKNEFKPKKDEEEKRTTVLVMSLSFNLFSEYKCPGLHKSHPRPSSTCRNGSMELFLEFFQEL